MTPQHQREQLHLLHARHTCKNAAVSACTQPSLQLATQHQYQLFWQQHSEVGLTICKISITFLNIFFLFFESFLQISTAGSDFDDAGDLTRRHWDTEADA